MGEKKSTGPVNIESHSLEELVARKVRGFVHAMAEANQSGVYHMLLAEFERPLVAIALEETRGNQVAAARLLGINRNTLRKKIGDLGIAVARRRGRPPRVEIPSEASAGSSTPR